MDQTMIGVSCHATVQPCTKHHCAWFGLIEAWGGPKCYSVQHLYLCFGLHLLTLFGAVKKNKRKKISASLSRLMLHGLHLDCEQNCLVLGLFENSQLGRPGWTPLSCGADPVKGTHPEFFSHLLLHCEIYYAYLTVGFIVYSFFNLCIDCCVFCVF